VARQRLQDWDVSLVTPQPAFQYSGMLPAVIAGTVAASAAQIPVAAIARAGGLNVHETSVTALDARARTLTLQSGDMLRYDVLSLDVGSGTARVSLPGVAEHAFAVRPFASALGLMSALDRALAITPRGGTVPVVVVGGGAAGIEIACALRVRILAAARVPRVTIVDARSRDGLPLAGFAEASRRVAHDALQSRGIALVRGAVLEVRADAVRTDATDQSEVPSVATAWVAGPAPHPWLADSGLACDARGYPLAAPTLALSADASVFGGGDCITLRDAIETPKAGVYAVRMAPVLAANVDAVARGRRDLARYAPQESFLALLSLGDGAALLRWRGVTLESRWAQWLKTRIDERYLRRYRALPVLPRA
jgi:selenide,water dikinase